MWSTTRFPSWPLVPVKRSYCLSVMHPVASSTSDRFPVPLSSRLTVTLNKLSSTYVTGLPLDPNPHPHPILQCLLDKPAGNCPVEQSGRRWGVGGLLRALDNIPDHNALGKPGVYAVLLNISCFTGWSRGQTLLTSAECFYERVLTAGVTV